MRACLELLCDCGRLWTVAPVPPALGEVLGRGGEGSTFGACRSHPVAFSAFLGHGRGGGGAGGQGTGGTVGRTLASL